MTNEVRDRRGVAFAADPPRRRLIALVPSATETLFALGLGERVLAVTEWCTTPAEEVARKPKVGGTKNPKCSAIAALEPDLVVMNAEENRRKDVERLEAAGVPVFVAYARTVREAAEEIRLLGRLTGKAAEADAIAGRIEAALAEAARLRPAVPPRVAYLVWKKPYMVANGDTFISDMIRSAGGVNVFADAPERYREVSAPELAAARPDVAILPDEPYRFAEADAEELRRELADAGSPGTRVRLANGELLCWHGPRAPEGLAHMRERIA